ncbi:hypothetical protein M758_UG120600 [Ceratodon purpureus]|nr:hypothetical protein M758_UG120600 [Ceratodon purpureus]
MATRNFFDLLGDDENEDPSQVVVRANSISIESKLAAGVVKKPGASAKVPTNFTAPAEAVKDGQRIPYDGARGVRGSGRGGRGGRGNYGDRDGGPHDTGISRERNFNNDRSAGMTRDADGFVGPRISSVEKLMRVEDGEGRSYDGGRGGGRGRGRGGRGFGDGEERPRRREFDRHSGNARGNEAEKRAGAGRGNWGIEVDVALIQENVESVKNDELPAGEGDTENKHQQEVSTDATLTGGAAVAVKEEEAEDNEMTLEEYEKLLEEKRKALEAEKTSERKVEVDKAFEKMQLVDNKKRDEDIFIKLGQDKEKVKRDAAEREDKSRKVPMFFDFSACSW